jgi:hypothetical protein
MYTSQHICGTIQTLSGNKHSSPTMGKTKESLVCIDMVLKEGVCFYYKMAL